MKKGRKVKSLISHQVSFSERSLTILLLILSFLLCLGSASLMTTFVGAEDSTPEDGVNDVIFSGNDSKTEVLYNLFFVDPENLNGDILHDVNMSGNILYMTGKVNLSGANNTGIHLGGSGNDVSSENVMMIAGLGNTVNNGADNVSVLGGSGNKVDPSDDSVPAVMAGGNDNSIGFGKGDVILGGSGNNGSHSNNAIDLGGEGNTVNGNNVIVGGKEVNVTLKNDVFAFSDGESNENFQPKSDSAFYLNLTNGVGINADSNGSGVSVGGAVKFGSVDEISCNSNNLGVEGILNLYGYGCLVSCTETSKVSSRWELLDRGENCEEKCKTSGKCLVPSYENEQEWSYAGYCTETPNHVGTIVRCTTGEWASYRNVVFQAVKVDDESSCNKNGDNKCEYYIQ